MYMVYCIFDLNVLENSVLLVETFSSKVTLTDYTFPMCPWLRST